MAFDFGSIGSIGTGLAGLFGGGTSPGDAAMPYLEQMAGNLPQYYQPYMDAGQQALPGLQDQYGQLMNDPGKRMNQIGESFQQSPGLQFQMDQAITGGNRAAAASGMLGSGTSMNDISRNIQGLAQQDYNNWLNNALGMYGQGLSGNQNLYNTGFEASTGLAGNLANIAGSQAQLAYQDQAGKNQAQGSALGGLIGGIGSLLSFL